MLSQNKGYIILPTLIIFSILSITTLYCINLVKTNTDIVELDYKKITLEEESYGNLQLVLSNILSEIDKNKDILSNESEFNEYFSSNEFLSKVKINGTIITPNLETKEIDFSIKSIATYENLSSTCISNVYIKNPFIDKDYNDIKDLLVYSFKEF